MKANKFFALAVAALALVACGNNNGNEPEEKKLSLDKSELNLKPEETKTLKANIAVEFTVDVEDVVELVPANDGKSVKVTGVKEGEATITATAGDQKKTCKVTVSKEGGDDEGDDDPIDYSDFPVLQGKEYYVFFLQKGATDYLGNKVVYNFGPNDKNRWLYIWGGTFGSGNAIGSDPFDGIEGWTSLVQSPGTWAGAGLCVGIVGENNPSGEGADDDLAALNGIQNHITNYDEWYLAIAAKNKEAGAAYAISLIGSCKDEGAVGEDGKPTGTEHGVGKFTFTPKATGEWDYQEIQLSKITGLEFGDFNWKGSNIFTFVAEPFKPGVQFDLGYVFLYKK